MSLFFGLMFMHGAVFASSSLLPWFIWASEALTLVLVVLVLPLWFVKRWRPGLVVALLGLGGALVFTVWIECILILYALWGVIAVVIGFVLALAPIFPLALIAAAVAGEWAVCLLLLVTGIVGIGSCMLGYGYIDSQ